jgi:predicted O-methyltransferase YrrM
MTKDEALNCLNTASMITPLEGEVFYEELIKLPQKGAMLEIGTGYGHSATFFSRVKPDWIVFTVDFYGEYYEVIHGKKVVLNDMFDVAKYFETWGASNILQIIGDSTKIPWNIPIDAIFIDGNHDYEFVKSDFERFSPFLKKGGVILFHDANWDGVKQLLDEIGAEIPEDKKTVAIWRKKK